MRTFAFCWTPLTGSILAGQVATSAAAGRAVADGAVQIQEEMGDKERYALNEAWGDAHQNIKSHSPWVSLGGGSGALGAFRQTN